MVTDKEILNTIESLKKQYEDVKTEIRDRRKKGEDVKIASLMLKMVPPKIQMAIATKEWKDVKKIEVMVERVKEELGLYKKNIHVFLHERESFKR
jgi:cephalosporin-C deacetylase-like acetyl esterase